jgi:biopolymer transport protein TolR
MPNMSSSRRGRRRLVNEINVVPYIDVMLVLLVIFMVTAPLVPTGQIELPTAGRSSSPPDALVEIQVRPGGELRLLTRNMPQTYDRTLGRRDLAPTLRELGDPATLAVLIAADAKVPYGEVVTVMDDVRALSRDEFVRFAAPVRKDPALGAAGANVDIVAVVDRGACAYRTFERGVEDETEACGTGAVVIAAVLAHLGLVDPPVGCRTSGGDVLDVALERTVDGAASCLLTGPAVISFRGAFRPAHYEHP